MDRKNFQHITSAACLLLFFAISVHAQAAPPTKPQENAHVTQHVTGPFEVKMTPQKPDSEVAEAAKISRMSGDKQFHGDLEATSKVEMLAVQTEVKGSAAYVAMERVTGTLKGRKGSFALQHTGIMNRGVPSLVITVVPDSGTDELKGLSGKMSIIIAGDGKHSYDFEFTLE